MQSDGFDLTTEVTKEAQSTPSILCVLCVNLRVLCGSR